MTPTPEQVEAAKVVSIYSGLKDRSEARKKIALWIAERDASRDAINERVATIQAHRACGGIEHDPSVGKFHGNCVVCLVPFPCEYVGQPAASAKKDEEPCAKCAEDPELYEIRPCDHPRKP